MTRSQIWKADDCKQLRELIGKQARPLRLQLSILSRRKCNDGRGTVRPGAGADHAPIAIPSSIDFGSMSF
jgi:hypothetical protein